ncbi:hypothetical protein HYQ46_007586 [Verticillium longisporum]|nr:hypothetical protein HYQ46_007586 [Verticillium longisporum]
MAIWVWKLDGPAPFGSSGAIKFVLSDMALRSIEESLRTPPSLCRDSTGERWPLPDGTSMMEARALSGRERTVVGSGGDADETLGSRRDGCGAYSIVFVERVLAGTLPPRPCLFGSLPPILPEPEHWG